MRSPTDRVEQAYRAIAEAGRPEVWIELRPKDVVLDDALSVGRRLAAGDRLPLAGLTLAVKDNIDVAQLPTTAGCPAFGYVPEVDAPAVAACRKAGALILGKTNLDQFATGLVGTRSPYGAVRDVRDPSRVAGGSSSGSAVAVALGIADVALGTDTAGSGRVPAAFQGIVGMKPTRGVVSTRGVVPACRSFDCVSVFAATAAHATSVLRVMANVTHALDSAARAWPGDAPLGAPPRPSVAVPSPDLLAELSAEARAAFTAAVDRCAAIGAEIIEADIEPLVAAGSLLYGGAFVAERYAAVGRFIAAHPCDVDPTVAQIITAGAAITAADYVADAERLDSVRVLARQILHGRDALLLPTAPFQPTLDGVAADPIGVNARLGRFTTFCNLLDMCAVAVPAGTADDGHFGVSLLAPAFHDWVLADLASRMTGADDDLVTQRSEDSGVPPRSQILVVGAHLTGQPLNRQLIERGGRFVRSVRTREDYRLYALTTEPPKPGLVRTASPVDGSPGIAGEVWALPPAGLASLLEQIPQPMVLGRVTLDDGSPITGFLCEPEAIVGAKDITGHGGWLAYLGARPIRGQNA